MDFSVHILGCGAALPTSERNCTSQFVCVARQNILIDCGEGAQLAIRKNKLSLQKIGSIFISHLHGDHFFGLPGLLFTMHLLGRKEILHIYAPEQLEEIINLLLKASNSEFSYPIEYTSLKSKEGECELLLENNDFKVSAFPVLHKIPTWGFLIEEKSFSRKLKKTAVSQYLFSFEEMHNIKAGKDYVTETGEIIPNNLLTYPPPMPRKYAYCADTAYSETIVPFIEGVDMLYHETTFCAKDELLAQAKFHSTTLQAARLADKARVKKLIIGHFSSRYEKQDISTLVEEARTIFPNTYAASDNAVFEIERIV